MKLETILENWEIDSEIKQNDLGNESLKTSQLHHKYQKIYTNESLMLRRYEADLKVLKLEKYEFYTQGPTKEQMDLGWKLPAAGRILKQEVNNYMDADKDIIQQTLKIGIQHEKIDLLESIIKTINNRGFQIKNAIDFMRWQNGV